MLERGLEKDCCGRQGLLISLGNTCYYRCPFCAYLKKRHAHILSASHYIEILRKTSALGCRDLEIGGQGDPVNFEGFREIVSVAYDLGFKIRVLSYIQNKEEVLLNLPKLNMLTVNLNATSEKEFQKIHVPKRNITFDSTLNILAQCLNQVKAKHLSTGVKINYVVHKETFLSSMSFPQQLYKVLKHRFKIDHPIHVNYHHMLITPANYALCPDQQELENMVEVFEKAGQHDFLRIHTNIADFLDKTKQILSLYRFVGPFKQDTFSQSSSHEFIQEKVNGRFWCDACKEFIFIDCNGDVFGCCNPTRMIYGFPAQEDKMFFGNILDKPLEEILQRKNSAGRFYPDLTKKFWKACVICGLNNKKK